MNDKQKDVINRLSKYLCLGVCAVDKVNVKDYPDGSVYVQIVLSNKDETDILLQIFSRRAYDVNVSSRGKLWRYKENRTGKTVKDYLKFPDVYDKCRMY